MRDSTAENNIAHQKALDEVAAFKARGGKITYDVKPNKVKGTPSRVPQKRGWLKSDYNKAARNDEKFLDALKTKGTMKKSQLSDFTGISYTALTACVTRLKRGDLITVFVDGTLGRGEEKASYSLK